jgi:DNA-binding transcriptional MerR regulator
VETAGLRSWRRTVPIPSVTCHVEADCRCAPSASIPTSGFVPASARSTSGYRLYDVEAVARLDLVSTLRDLGLSLESIRALLNAQTSLPEVAAVHLTALDQQIQTLRLRRAVLRAAAKTNTNTTAEEVALMHRLATMSEVERQHLIDDFLDDAFWRHQRQSRARRDAASDET